MKAYLESKNAGLSATVTLEVISGRQEGLFSWFRLIEQVQKNAKLNALFGTTPTSTAGDIQKVINSLVYYEMGGASSQTVFTLKDTDNVDACLS